MIDAVGDRSLEGRRALVTGAGSGIGAAIVEALAREGCRVAVNDLDRGSAEATADALGDAAVVAVGDVTDGDSARSVVEVAVAGLGGLDILVNNAAAPVRVAPFEALGEDDVRASLSSFHAALQCTRAAIGHLRRAEHGRIVSVTSITGRFGGPGLSVYGAAKGALHAWSAGLAKELAPDGITVNCVAPGVVDTPRQRGRPEHLREQRRRSVPLGRFATCEEVAHGVVYLCQDLAGYVTGAILPIDGGRP